MNLKRQQVQAPRKDDMTVEPVRLTAATQPATLSRAGPIAISAPDRATSNNCLKWPFFGLQDWWRSKRVRRIEDQEAASRPYRYLARQIAADFPYADGGRLILVGSLSPITLIGDMLLMFACYAREELGCRLLLVDGTFRPDGISAELGHADAPGLNELLCDSGYRLKDLVKPTERAGIFLLPAGRPRQHPLSPSELPVVSTIFDEARRAFDYVLLQQASILTDTRYLLFTKITDIVLLVAEEGTTSLAELERCEQLLRDHQISKVRLLLATGD